MLLKNPSLFKGWLQELSTQTIMVATWYKMLPTASVQWRRSSMLPSRCNNTENPNFRFFTALVQSESYKQYNQEFVKTWRLKNTDSVVMGPAADMYVGYESTLSRQHPKFLSIAMLPCTMLWPWIAGELIDSVDKKNPYYGWFEDNKPDPSHKSHLEKFVDHFFSPEEKEKSLLVFHEGMINELNFFRDACDETLFYYSYFNI